MEEPKIEPQRAQTPENTHGSGADANRILTPEEIARLFAAQNDPATAPDAAFEEPAEAPAAIEPDSAPDPNGIMTPEDIARLFAAQNDPAPAPDAAFEEPAEATAAIEPDSAPDPNGIMTPEDVARLFAAQNDPAPAPDAAFEDPAAAPEQNLSPEDPAELFAAQSEPENPGFPGPADAEPATAPVPESLPPDTAPTGNALKKVKANPAALLAGGLQKLLSGIKLPALKGRASVSGEDAGKAEKRKPANPISRLLGALKRPRPQKKGDRSQTAEEPAKLTAEGASQASGEAGAAKDSPQEKVPRGRSGLKTALGILGVLLLMTGSFAAGYVAKDFLAPPVQDPARQQAEAEALANEARAKELAEISPKDYTASMYLDAILLKGKAEKTTTVKLQKIDDVSKLTAFPNLRRIKIDGMTGDEDLSVLQELGGVEEIIIENSVLRNQFRQGRFDSVTYIEMYDCTIEDSSQFANFKGLTQFYAYSTKFVTETGTLELTTYLPAAETLTLSNCGEFEELAGVRDLGRLKSLSLSSRTLIRNMTYTENPAIERLKVDVSFVEDIQQLQKLADLKNLKHITLQSKTDRLTASQLNNVKRWIKNRFPEATVETATY